MKPKPKKPSKFRTSGGTPSTHHPSFPVSLFSYINILIPFYTVCRVKGKNNPPAEAKLKARAARAEEAED
jgi:hypothetical protein